MCIQCAHHSNPCLPCFCLVSHLRKRFKSIFAHHISTDSPSQLHIARQKHSSKIFATCNSQLKTFQLKCVHLVPPSSGKRNSSVDGNFQVQHLASTLQRLCVHVCCRPQKMVIGCQKRVVIIEVEKKQDEKNGD